MKCRAFTLVIIIAACLFINCHAQSTSDQTIRQDASYPFQIGDQITGGGDSVPYLTGRDTAPDKSEYATESSHTGSRLTRYWSGAASEDWHDPANWYEGAVPTMYDDAVIPHNDYYDHPADVTSPAAVNNMIVDAGGRMRIHDTTFTAYNDISVSGELILYGDNSNSATTVGRDIVFFSGARFVCIGSESNHNTVNVQRDLKILSGVDIAYNQNTLTLCFAGSGNSHFEFYANFELCNLTCDKLTGTLYIQNMNNSTLTVTNNITTQNNGNLVQQTPGTIILQGSLATSATSVFGMSVGTLAMQGSTGEFINPLNSNSFLHDLTIAKSSASVGLIHSITVYGTLTIDSGSLSVGSSTITLGGNWVNNAGPDAFNEGTGTVELIGTAHQYCSHNEDFHNLTVNNTGGAFRISNGAAVTCSSYTCLIGAVDVLSGTFTAYDLAQDGIWGNFYNNPGGTINLYQDADHRIDLNGTIYNYGGTYNIHGGTTAIYLAFAANGGIEQSSGTIDIKERGLIIANTGYTANLNVTGGIVRIAGGIIFDLPDMGFTGGTVELYGSLVREIDFASGCYFKHLTINKDPTVSITLASGITVKGDLIIASGIFDSGNQTISLWGNWINNVGPDGFIEGTGTVEFFGTETQYCHTQENFHNLLINKQTGISLILLGQVQCLNNGGIQIDYGNLDLNHNLLRVTGNIQINLTGKLRMDDDAVLELADSCSIVASMGGILECTGSAGHEARISHNGTGYYSVEIDSWGSVYAAYCIFEYMGENGLWLKGGSQMDAYNNFNNCTFRNGKPNGTLIKAECETVFEVHDAVFPANTWGSLHNVEAPYDRGGITFYNATGDFAGAAFEDDPFHRINWTYDNSFTEINAGLAGIDYSSSAWGDYDNDGDLDILQAGWTGSERISRIYRNEGDGAFTDINAGLPGVSDCCCAWGDYDNDGDLDILLAGYTGSTAISSVYRNEGSGIFSDINAGLTGARYSSCAWGDYDNDGDLDILLAGSSMARIYQNNDGIFSDLVAGLPNLTHCSVTWGDYDNDQDLDVLLAGNGLTRIYNNSNGFFANSGAVLPGLSYCSVCWGDYDNDGDMDILCQGMSGDRIARVYRNEGNNSFADISAGLPGLADCTAKWGDYDNDGDLDILLGGYNGTYCLTEVYRNDGADTFTAINAGLMDVGWGTTDWGDFDNDGDLDILLTGAASAGYYSKIWQNNLNTSNAPPAQPTNLQINPSGDYIVLSWTASTDDHTPPAGLNYILRIGTTSVGSEISAAMSASGGFRKLPQRGYANTCSWKIQSNILDGLSYYWSVQAVDTAFRGSAFAVEQGVNISGPPKAPDSLRIMNVENDILISWAAVTEDIHGLPLEPDYYNIYYNQDGYVSGIFTYLGSSDSLFYLHENAILLSAQSLYFVKAFMADPLRNHQSLPSVSPPAIKNREALQIPKHILRK